MRSASSPSSSSSSHTHHRVRVYVHKAYVDAAAAAECIAHLCIDPRIGAFNYRVQTKQKKSTLSMHVRICTRRERAEREREHIFIRLSGSAVSENVCAPKCCLSDIHCTHITYECHAFGLLAHAQLLLLAAWLRLLLDFRLVLVQRATCFVRSDALHYTTAAAAAAAAELLGASRRIAQWSRPEPRAP